MQHMARDDTAQHSIARYCIALNLTSWYYVAVYGSACYYMVLYRTVQHCAHGQTIY